MSERGTCPHCGAAATSEDGRFCAYCGAAMPRAPAVQSGPRPLAERLADVRAHPDLPALLEHEPDDSAVRRTYDQQTAFGAVFAGFALTFLPAGCFAGVVVAVVVGAFGVVFGGLGGALLGRETGAGVGAGSGVSIGTIAGVLTTLAFIAIPVVFVVIGLKVASRARAERRRLTTARVVATVAGVVDERAEISGGEHARTTHHVTLETEDGARREWPVAGTLAGLVTPGDVGVAYTKADHLLEFLRVDVAP